MGSAIAEEPVLTLGFLADDGALFEKPIGEAADVLNPADASPKLADGVVLALSEEELLAEPVES